MKNSDLPLLGFAAWLALAFGAQAADLPTSKDAAAPATSPCFDSFYDYMNSTAQNCPLTWNGITLYGIIDMGVGYSSHGANFNPAYPQGVQEVIAKFSQGQKYQVVPGGLSRSNAGVKAKEEFAPGWSFLFNVNTDFNPYSLQLANGPESLVQNNNKTIGNQSANGDSSRAGQWDNTQGYVGLSHSVYGTLTAGRQNSFTADAVTKYDPMGGSYAFSLIGNSATYVSGMGFTETTRYNTSVKYQVNLNNFRAGAVWQFGGYSLGNGSNGVYQFDVGADYAGFSFDAIYGYSRDAVALSTYSADPLPTGVTQEDLKATLADVSGVVLAGKYSNGPMQLFAGYEYAVFSPPSDTYPDGFTTLGGFNVLPGAASVTNYINNKILQVGWVGAKYALRSDIDITGAYYVADQNDYAPPGSKPNVCQPNTKAPVPGRTPQGALNSYCAGELQAISGLIDFRPLKRVDLYAGVMYSHASGGIASGYIHSNNLAPTAGLRLSF
jgi:predicted porin